MQSYIKRKGSVACRNITAIIESLDDLNLFACASSFSDTNTNTDAKRITNNRQMDDLPKFDTKRKYPKYRETLRTLNKLS